MRAFFLRIAAGLVLLMPGGSVVASEVHDA